MDCKREVLYAKATVGEEEKKAVQDVLNNPTQMSNGPKTAELENTISSLFDKKHGIMVNSGSSANYLAVESLALPEQGEVITPATTFSTTVAPLVKNNLTPVFVDIDLRTYQVSIDQVQEAITTKTCALMIPSLIGNLPQMDQLKQLADDHDLMFIEDSADTIGAEYDGNPTGYYSDISTTSFYGSHIITGFGGGGMVCTEDDEIKNKMKKLRGWGRGSAVDETEDIEKRLDSDIGGKNYDSKFIFDEIGYNYLPLEASAAFALAQIGKLNAFAEDRSKNFNQLHKALTDYEDIFHLPTTYKGVDTNWLAFPLTLKDDASFDRKSLVEYLEKNGIQTRSLWSGNILHHPGFQDINHRVAPDGLDTANYVMENSFVIGCHQSITEKDITYISNVISDFL